VGITECCGLAVADVSIVVVTLVVALSQAADADADATGLVVSDDDPIGTDAGVASGAFATTLDEIPMSLSVTLPATAASSLGVAIVLVASLSSLIRLFAGRSVDNDNRASSAVLTPIVGVTVSTDAGSGCWASPCSVMGILIVVATVDDAFETVSTADEDVSSLTPSCLHSTPTPIALIDY